MTRTEKILIGLIAAIAVTAGVSAWARDHALCYAQHVSSPALGDGPGHPLHFFLLECAVQQ